MLKRRTLTLAALQAYDGGLLIWEYISKEIIDWKIEEYSYIIHSTAFIWAQDCVGPESGLRHSKSTARGEGPRDGINVQTQSSKNRGKYCIY